MYTLFVAKPAFGARTASPFATKALSLMHLSGVAFQRQDASPVQGPRQKLPYLKRPDGTIIADSWNIRQHLVAEEGLQLSPAPGGTALRRLVEEHLYFAQVYFRWMRHGPEIKSTLFAEVAWPIRPLVYQMVRRNVVRTLYGQGIGRRPESEILAVVRDDLDALEEAIEGRTFLGGSALAAVDLSVHGLLDQLVTSTFADPFIQAVKERSSLVAYHRRVDTRVYPGAADEAQEAIGCSMRS
ncbi:MAG: glutathione S-transferase family protein [Myxococcota bacterium]